MGKIITRYHNFDNVKKITYSINEVRGILNLSRNKTYQLVSSNVFPVILVNRTKHIPIKSFHKWVKENMSEVILPTEEDGNSFVDLETKKTLSVPEIRKLLNLKKTSAYELMKSETFNKIYVNGFIRITKESFYNWFYAINEKETL